MSYFISAKSHLFVSWPWCTEVPIELVMSNGARILRYTTELKSTSETLFISFFDIIVSRYMVAK
jgi:hypothetical protein